MSDDALWGRALDEFIAIGLQSIADGNEDAARSLREAVEELARLF